MGRPLLRRRREELGLTRSAAARKVGVVAKTWRRWETAESEPHVWQRPAIATTLGWTLSEVAIALDTDRPELNGHDVPPWLGHLASLEHAAAEIQAFEPVVIHGLLQTANYATAVERAGRWYNEDEVTQRVQIRIARQDVLHREPDPLRLRVVLDESALLRVAGGPEVMAAQLDHLAELGAELPNVTVQVMPLSSDVFPVAFGAFKLLTSPETGAPYMACIEDGAGPHYMDRTQEIDRHVELFSYLSGVALSPDQSLQLIHETSKERYR